MAYHIKMAIIFLHQLQFATFGHIVSRVDQDFIMITSYLNLLLEVWQSIIIFFQLLPCYQQQLYSLCCTD